MGHLAVRAGTEAASILKEVWTDQFELDPTEEGVIAPLVATPNGVRKIGKKLHLRKLQAQSANKLTPSSHTTTMVADNLTYNQNTEVEVTVTPVVYYAGIELNRDAMNEIIDDGEAIAGWRSQMLAVLNEKIDFEIFSLVNGLSQSEVGADTDDAMIRSALGKLAKYAKRKFKIGKTPFNVILHPDEIKNALNIPALKEYQIRGTQGSATSGQLVSAYGANFEESGLVLVSAGTAYQPLFIKDAWALGWNEKPHILEPQTDGLATRFLAYTEFGVSEWFDSSGITLNVTV